MSTLLAAPGLAKRSSWFHWRLFNRAAQLSLSADCLAAIMGLESGTGPAAKNPNSGASGLIQIMPSYAHNYGTTPEGIRAMSAEDQLDKIVFPFFNKSAFKNENDCGKLYLGVFLPAFYDSPESKILGEKGGTEILAGKLTTGAVYAQNSGFDRDKDGIFTAGDVRGFMRGLVSSWQQHPRVAVPEVEPPRPSSPASAGDWLSTAAVLLVAGGIFWKVVK